LEVYNHRQEINMNGPDWLFSPDHTFLFIGSFILWMVIELINNLVIGRHRQGGQGQDKGSFWVVFVTVYAATLFIVLTRWLGWGVISTPVQWVGLGLAWIGLLVREWAVLSLGRFFTVLVEINPNQHLITSGLYRWIRHPAYTGGILTMTGFGLAAGTWIGAILALAVTVIGYSYRVRIEERAMLAAFGEEYRGYMRHTGKFFPRVPV
jgi:protein-S-isoprenylcysteine O-methyltransferase Ste14